MLLYAVNGSLCIFRKSVIIDLISTFRLKVYFVIIAEGVLCVGGGVFYPAVPLIKFNFSRRSVGRPRAVGKKVGRCKKP